MKRLALNLLLGLSFLLSSCSLGLVAVHQEFPCICFKAKCRELAKNEKKNTAHVVNSGKRSAKLNKGRKKKHKKTKSGKSSKTKKISKKARFN